MRSQVVNIELNQRQATCSVTYAFRWKDIGTEKTVSTSAFCAAR